MPNDFSRSLGYLWILIALHFQFVKWQPCPAACMTDNLSTRTAAAAAATTAENPCALPRSLDCSNYSTWSFVMPLKILNEFNFITYCGHWPSVTQAKMRKTMKNWKKNNVCAAVAKKTSSSDIKFYDMRPLNLHKENVFSSSFSSPSLFLRTRLGLVIKRICQWPDRAMVAHADFVSDHNRETETERRPSRLAKACQLVNALATGYAWQARADTKPKLRLSVPSQLVCVGEIWVLWLARSGLSCYLWTCLSTRSFTYK